MVSITPPRHCTQCDNVSDNGSDFGAKRVQSRERERERHEPVMRRDVVTVVCKAAQPSWK